MRQHTSAYVNIRQLTSAYVSIRQHTSAYVSIRQSSIRQHTSAYLRLIAAVEKAVTTHAAAVVAKKTVY